MDLLIVPAILAGGAYWLRQREQAAEEKTRQREQADKEEKTRLQTYRDKMTELLLKENLRESKVESEVRAVARSGTLTVLQRLNGDRKGALLRFLYEADLIDKVNIVINLDGADLSEANLSKANLSGADLNEAKLSFANLSWAKLIEADLSGADLSWAKLIEAKYTKNAKDIRGTIWSDGFDLENTGAICVNE